MYAILGRTCGAKDMEIHVADFNNNFMLFVSAVMTRRIFWSPTTRRILYMVNFVQCTFPQDKMHFFIPEQGFTFLSVFVLMWFSPCFDKSGNPCWTLASLCFSLISSNIPDWKWRLCWCKFPAENPTKIESLHPRRAILDEIVSPDFWYR